MEFKYMPQETHAPIVHIGLPKTATSSLQKNVFPEISKMTNWIFNDNDLISELREIVSRPLKEKDVSLLRKHFARQRHFISFEGLVESNPRNWEWAADRNKEIFSENATIIITIRETEDFLRAMYQQQVHHGNIRPPEEFFVNSREYDELALYLAPCILARLDVDSVNYRRLYDIYTEKFRRVILVPFEEICEMRFLTEIFNLSELKREHLCLAFQKNKAANISYSEKAMQLTFFREKFIRRLGLVTRGSDIYKLENLSRRVVHRGGGKSGLNGGNLVRCKLVPPVMKIFAKICNVFRWKLFLQNCFDRILPYRKYSLPRGIYVNQELIKENRIFLSEIREKNNKYGHGGVIPPKNDRGDKWNFVP